MVYHLSITNSLNANFWVCVADRPIFLKNCIFYYIFVNILICISTMNFSEILSFL